MIKDERYKMVEGQPNQNCLKVRLRRPGLSMVFSNNGIGAEFGMIPVTP